MKLYISIIGMLFLNSCNHSWSFENSVNHSSIKIQKSNVLQSYYDFFKSDFKIILDKIILNHNSLNLETEIEIIWIVNERDELRCGVLQIDTLLFSISSENSKEIEVVEGINHPYFKELKMNEFSVFSKNLHEKYLGLSDAGSGFYILINKELKEIISINN